MPAPDPDLVLHAFRTFGGIPADKGTPPACGAAITDAYDFPGITRPTCQACADLIAAEGEERTLTLPFSEVCMFMGIAGQTMVGRHRGRMVDLLRDGRPFCGALTEGEAGWDRLGSDHTITDFDAEGRWYKKERAA